SIVRCYRLPLCLLVSFSTATAPTEISTLSLHDALPICETGRELERREAGTLGVVLVRDRRAEERHRAVARVLIDGALEAVHGVRSEEHTSELQSRENLVCRLLLEKKKKNKIEPRCNRAL